MHHLSAVLLSIDANYFQVAGGKLLSNPCCREQHGDSRILKDELNTLDRVGGIEWHVNAARFCHPQNGRDHIGGALQQDPDPHFRPDAVLLQITAQNV